MNTETSNGSNKPTAEDYLKMSEELGKDHGKGGDAQVKFANMCVEGGYHGSLSSDKKKYPDGNGDHFRQAAAYMKGRGTAEVFGGKKLNERVMLSKTKTFIDFGGNPKWGPGQPLQIFQQLTATWRQLKARKVDGLADIQNTMLDFIRVQKKQALLMSKEELERFCFLKGAKPTSPDKVLEDIAKRAKKLAAGKIANCEAFDSDDVKQVIKSAQEGIRAVMKARAQGKV